MLRPSQYDTASVDESPLKRTVEALFSDQESHRSWSSSSYRCWCALPARSALEDILTAAVWQKGLQREVLDPPLSPALHNMSVLRVLRWLLSKHAQTTEYSES
jgi:hypothetical protein